MKALDAARQRVERTARRLRAWVDERQDRPGPVGLAAELYDRDREAFASVLGSAIALRLFLFVVPANVALLGLASLLQVRDAIGDALEGAPTTGTMAQNYDDLSVINALWISLTGIVLTLWAGRTLARVLAVCSGAAWQLGASAARLTVRAAATLTGLVFALALSSFAFARLRDNAGIPTAVAIWVVVLGTYFVGWFFVQLALPRATSDPGAILPGAALMGVGFAILQWVMEIYLPARIERTADTLGSLAATVASLGYFFFIGRLMAASFVVNSVVFDRWGSISRVVFALPGLRRLPARFPRWREFFDLERPDDDVL